MAVFLWWVSVTGILYTYAGYPGLIALLAAWRNRAPRKGAVDLRVSVLMAVHNEAGRLPAKIRGLLAAPPAGCLLEILVGSDGSEDHPAEALRGIGDARVQVIEFAGRRGKPAVLNDLMARARGNLVVMVDARQEADPGLLAALLPNFADPEVGVVSGELIFRRPAQSTATAEGMDAYWRYEKFIRRQEARFRSVPGATGALYAIRRELLRPIPPQTLLDDVAIPMLAVRQGYRCVFESAAVVFDEPSRSPGQESVRKRRTLAGTAQLAGLFPWLLWPGRNPIWFEFFSHKVMRLIVPYLMGLAWLANLALLRDPFFALCFAAQMAFYLLAAWGWLAARRGRRGGWLSVPYLFVSLNVVAVLALADVLTGRTRVQWSRSPMSA